LDFEKVSGKKVGGFCCPSPKVRVYRECGERRTVGTVFDPKEARGISPRVSNSENSTIPATSLEMAAARDAFSMHTST